MQLEILKNELVFDGAESDFYSFQFEVECLHCKKVIDILADDMLPLEDISDKKLLKLLTKTFKLRRKVGGFNYENEKGLESYYTECSCNSCGNKNYVVASIGEIQPTRFQVCLDGILVK